MMSKRVVGIVLVALLILGLGSTLISTLLGAL